MSRSWVGADAHRPRRQHHRRGGKGRGGGGFNNNARGAHRRRGGKGWRSGPRGHIYRRFVAPDEASGPVEAHRAWSPRGAKRPFREPSPEPSPEQQQPPPKRIHLSKRWERQPPPRGEDGDDDEREEEEEGGGGGLSIQVDNELALPAKEETPQPQPDPPAAASAAAAPWKRDDGAVEGWQRTVLILSFSHAVGDELPFLLELPTAAVEQLFARSTFGALMVGIEELCAGTTLEAMPTLPEARLNCNVRTPAVWMMKKKKKEKGFGDADAAELLALLREAVETALSAAEGSRAMGEWAPSVRVAEVAALIRSYGPDERAQVRGVRLVCGADAESQAWAARFPVLRVTVTDECCDDDDDEED